jgi:hypothetical protein
MNTVPEPRTAAALAARRGRTDTALLRVHESIARLQREKTQVSVVAVARRANVSRTFLRGTEADRAPRRLGTKAVIQPSENWTLATAILLRLIT